MDLFLQLYRSHYLCEFLTCFCLTIVAVKSETYIKFQIGGLFAVHYKGEGGERCGKIRPEKGIQRVEAMFYAIDQINNNDTYWNFTLEPYILDTCSTDSVAIQESSKFLEVNCNNNITRKITGVIGANNSPVSEAVAVIFRMFKIPQVSYASTSVNLDNVHKFPYFFRVVPSNKFQVQAISDLIHTMRWNYISAVAKEGEYGTEVLKHLKDEINKDRSDVVCFVSQHVIPRYDTDEDYDRVVDTLLSHKKSRVVVVILYQNNLRKLLEASQKKDPNNPFIWISNHSWGTKTKPLKSLQTTAEGALIVMMNQNRIEGYDEYFKSLRPRKNKRNPWFDEYWENQFNCSVNRSTSHAQKNCTGDETDSEFKQESLVPMVVDAVYVMAHALKNMCKENQIICTNWDQHRQGELLRYHIQNVNFSSAQGEGVRIKFDENRSLPINYKIFQYKRNGTGHNYEEIGEWTPSNRLEMRTLPRWSQGSRSSCSDNCYAGYEREYQEKSRCCWTCHPCEENFFFSNTKGKCMPCESGYKSNDNKTICELLIPEYLGDDWNSPWVLVPVIFSIVGVITTLITFAIFLLYHETPIIKASGRELCHVIFFGILLCYLFTFFAVAKPSANTCGFVRANLGLGLSVCYAAILTKTNRISRIFNSNLRNARRLMYISPKSQLIICFCLVLIQIAFSVMWLIMKSPKAEQIIVKSPYAAILTCGIDSTSTILFLAYNMFLIILCTVYAFKTRNIPENFNEAKYISFSMYASCIIWLAFIPIYYSIWKDYKVQATILCMNVAVSGTIILLCFFSPKLYIVLFKPEKNVRIPTTSNSSGGGECPMVLTRQAETVPKPRIANEILQTETHTLASQTL